MLSLPAAFHAMNAYRQFIVYFLTPRPGTIDKLDKIPVDYTSGRYPVDAHNLKIWTDFNTASAYAQKFGSEYGVGFVLTKNDPFFFVDIDKSLTLPEKNWSKEAHDLIAMLPGAAVEVSSSGRGLHIIGSGVCPPHACTAKPSLEMYHEGRFIALTGAHAYGDSATDCSMYLPAVIDKYFPPVVYTGSLEWTTTACPEWGGPLDDAELIRRMLKSSSGLTTLRTDRASFHDLWDANEEILAMAYPANDKDVYNRSSADAALAQHLVFWTGANCERMLQLMKKSKLARDKWDREKYLHDTITKACGKKTKVLQDRPAVELAKSPAGKISELKPTRRAGNSFLSPDQQISYFAGCCYVRNSHMVLVPGGELIKPEQFKASYGGYQFIMSDENGKITDDAWKAFRNSLAIETPWANGSCFRPDLAPGAIVEKPDSRTFVNVYWPVKIRMLDGDPEPFMDFMKRLFPDDRDRAIILSYMAACVQYPGIKFRWCPLIQGVQGNGKTLLTRCLEQAIGERYTHFPRASEITSRFNDWMYGHMFVGIDDIYLPDSRMEVLEILKPIIDRERYEVEPKNGTKLTLDVCVNFMLNSNHKDAVKKTQDDRRFANFYTPQQSKADLKRDGMDGLYFPNLYDWLRGDGYAIVSWFLKHFEIPDEFNPATHCHRAPETTSTESAIREGFGMIEQEILEAIAQDEVGFRNGWVSSVYLDMYLERRSVGRRIPHNRRRALLQSLGYDWHPGLIDGRVNNEIMPDGKKPRLFVKTGHSSLQLTTAADIARAYTEDQNTVAKTNNE